MIPWEKLGATDLPGGGPLRLMRRGDEYSIRLAGNELMNSRMHGSEDALATLAIARLRERQAPHILIGGLGMGFTLRAALADLSAHARVTVCELLPAVVEWAKGPMAPIFAGCLDDPRVAIRIADVADVMTESNGVWDAILLDVDNGPEGLTQARNDRLYGLPGIDMARRALRHGGLLAVWSAHRDEGFASRMKQAGFKVSETTVRARVKSGAKHVIWIGVK